MPFELTRIEHIVVVHWLTVPSRADVEQLGKQMREAHREAGQRITLVGAVPAKLEGNPSVEVRDAMVNHMRRLLLDTCDAMHMVIAGRGIAGSLQRTVVRGMAVVVGMRGKLSVHESPTTCLARLRTDGIDERTLARLQSILESPISTTAQAP